MFHLKQVVADEDYEHGPLKLGHYQPSMKFDVPSTGVNSSETKLSI